MDVTSMVAGRMEKFVILHAQERKTIE